MLEFRTNRHFGLQAIVPFAGGFLQGDTVVSEGDAFDEETLSDALVRQHLNY